MKKTKILSSLLSLSLAASLAFPGALAMPARADGEPSSDNSGIVVNKTATENEDGSGYTITLEAYATGSTTTSTVTKDVPTDIVLVLDQSGSMTEKMGGYVYEKYSKQEGLFSSRNYYNSEYFPLRHNGGSNNLWHKLNTDQYVSVSVEQQPGYTPISDWNNHSYYQEQNNLYCKIGEDYKKVTVLLSWPTYTYKVDGQVICESKYSHSEPNFGKYAPLYLLAPTYVYSYTLDGETKEIEQSPGNEKSPNTQFYERRYSSTGGGSRLQALQTAATNFVDEVAKKAAGNPSEGTNPINHRIAVVSFANNANNLTNGLVGMNQPGGSIQVKSAINGLSAGGDTYPAKGLNVANTIFEANPIEQNTKRNRVIVLFTDGYPAESGTNDINYTLCDNAVASAYTSKKTYGATVYTVGIFSGADPTSDINTNFDYGNRQDSTKQLVAANRYMHYTSSNYKDAKSMQNGGSGQNSGYYLSASDANTLNNIFQNISQNITTGGSASTLGAEAVVKDIISPYFQLPAGATADDITLETYACTGKSGGTYQWATTSSGNGGASATVNGTGEVEVTGFNFSENWCGIEKDASGTETPHGSKLVISFTVEPKPGFLGGNNVPTNGEASGVYENATATNPLKPFPLPKVNVPIPEITVTAKDKNVYLMSDVPAEELKEGVTATCNGVNLLDKDTYTGENAWKAEFVEVTVGDITVKDKDDNTVTGGLSGLKEDGTYTFEVKVEPKTSIEGGVEEKTGKKEANIYVFKPELTFKDSEVYYGETAPTTFEGNLTKKEWKHEGAASTDASVTMTGTPPTLTFEYKPDATKIDSSNKINTKEDIKVEATVKIGTEVVNTYTTFKHDDCSVAGCTWGNPETLNGDPAFLLHVKTCTLEIKKVGGTDGEPYVFTVKKGGEKYTEVTIEGPGSVTISELPVGTYTITEDTGWSWRYTANVSDGVALSKDKTSGEITCNNTKNNEKWLNGFSEVVPNIFNEPHTGRSAK